MITAATRRRMIYMYNADEYGVYFMHNAWGDDTARWRRYSWHADAEYGPFNRRQWEHSQ